jgi:uncharacterized protein YqhQ
MRLVDDTTVLRVLAAADAAPSLPRLGGMARPDGVAIVSERFWSFSRADETSVDVRPMPRSRSTVARLPFLRGLVKLASAIVPLLGRNATASTKERLILLAALAAPVLLFGVPASYRTPALAAMSILLVCWMFRGRTLRLHGAEHRAIAAAESRALVTTWYGLTRPTRFSPRCGTNFAVLTIAVSALVERVIVIPSATLAPFCVTLVSLMITMEIWLLAQRSAGLLTRLLLTPGLLVQRLTTREPSVEDTRVALRAVAALLAVDG